MGTKELGLYFSKGERIVHCVVVYHGVLMKYMTAFLFLKAKDHEKKCRQFQKEISVD